MKSISIAQALRDMLDINPNISYDDSKVHIKTKYNKDLSRSNYDKIKSVRKSKILQEKSETPIGVQSKGKTSSRGSSPQSDITKVGSPLTTPTIDPNSLIGMDDIELIRHICRMAICSSQASLKERLDAAQKLLSLKDKQGAVDDITKQQKEVINQFSSQSNMTLSLLLKQSKESMQKGPENVRMSQLSDSSQNP